MRQRLLRLVEHDYARYVGLGVLTGLVLLTVALVWRGARTETIVLHVQPVDDARTIHVYVGGAVESPGVYSLDRGSRVADAISAAGGVTTEGDTSALGMAAPLRDADQIIIPARPSQQPSPVAAGSPASGNAPVSTSFSTDQSPADEKPININTAGVEQLDLLPGIGPAIAGRIVEFRLRNGFFRSVDELDKIQGISERMVDELRPLVTIGP